MKNLELRSNDFEQFRNRRKVEWLPQGGRKKPLKLGLVIAAIPPYKTPADFLGSLRDEYIVAPLEAQLRGHVKKRGETSYLVAVDCGRTKPVVFWPHQSKLKRIGK